MRAPRQPLHLLTLLLAGVGLWGCADALPPTPAPGSMGDRLHRAGPLFDLHVDPALWHGDLMVDEDRQAAVPALKAGGLHGVMIGLPTQGLPIIGGWWLFSWFYEYPKPARRSPWAAANAQLDIVHRALNTPGSPLQLATDLQEMNTAVAAEKIATFLSLEGGHAIEGELGRLAELKARGLTSVGVVHLSDNEYGGSNFSWGPFDEGGGLTPEGRAFVLEAQRLGLILDLAHTSRQTFFDILALTQGPILVSHTGINAVHRSWRNLQDDQLRALAQRDGLVGILFGNHYLGDDTLDAFLDHILHAIHIMGWQHVAIGTDFDGMVPLPHGIESAADFSRITQGLLNRGLSEEQARGVLGENWVRFLRTFERTSAPSPVTPGIRHTPH